MTPGLLLLSDKRGDQRPDHHRDPQQVPEWPIRRCGAAWTRAGVHLRGRSVGPRARLCCRRRCRYLVDVAVAVGGGVSVGARVAVMVAVGGARGRQSAYLWDWRIRRH